jgi:hypothetical protein
MCAVWVTLVYAAAPFRVLAKNSEGSTQVLSPLFDNSPGEAN